MQELKEAKNKLEESYVLQVNTIPSKRLKSGIYTLLKPFINLPVYCVSMNSRNVINHSNSTIFIF